VRLLFGFLFSALDGGGQLHGSGALRLEKSQRYTLGKRLGRPQSWSECSGEEKNLLPLPGIDPPFHGRSVHSPSLYRLSYPGPLH
jgi:hypothetical protein